jgi:hypothetical protein
VNNVSIRVMGLALAVFPFACMAVGGGRTDASSASGGAEAVTDGASGDASSNSTGGAATNASTATVVMGRGGGVGTSLASTGGSVTITYARTGGTTGTTTTSTVDPGTPPDPTATYGVNYTSPYPCTANTAAYYDEPPILDPAAGCKDIYNSGQFYPAGCTRTMVAPTAPNGASCVAVDCWCSETTQRWEPAGVNLCW